MNHGVLGGSFDPVHAGHVAAADAVLAAGLADRVTVLPAWRSPLKSVVAATADQRLEMVRLAFTGRPGCKVDAREIDHGRAVYTVETLAGLRADHPADRLRLIIGQDNLADFPRWHRPEAILRDYELVVLGRGGEEPNLAPLLDLGGDPDSIHVLADFDVPVSSTRIRAMIGTGRLPDEFMPESVARYIRQHHLYGA